MSLRDRLRGPDAVQGILCVIPSAVVAQAVAAAGADFLVIDREHGPIGREALHAMVAATAGTSCAPLVRVPSVDEGEVKLALDAGAEGVLFPLVRSADDVRDAVALVRYPPEGRRGWGPLVAHARHGVALGEYAATVGPRILCGVLIETREAVEAIDEILAVPGLDLAFVAQFDLAQAMGDGFEVARERIEAAAQRHGVALGTSALTEQDARAAAAAGHRFLICGFDTVLLAGAVAERRAWLTPP